MKIDNKNINKKTNNINKYKNGNSILFTLFLAAKRTFQFLFKLSPQLWDPLHRIERQKEYAIRLKISFVRPLSVEL